MLSGKEPVKPYYNSRDARQLSSSRPPSISLNDVFHMITVSWCVPTKICPLSSVIRSFADAQ